MSDLLNAGPAAVAGRTSVEGMDCSELATEDRFECIYPHRFQRLLHAHKYSTLTVGLYLNSNVAVYMLLLVCVKQHVSTCRKVSMGLPSCLFFHVASSPFPKISLEL